MTAAAIVAATNSLCIEDHVGYWVKEMPTHMTTQLPDVALSISCVLTCMQEEAALWQKVQDPAVEDGVQHPATRPRQHRSVGQQRQGPVLCASPRQRCDRQHCWVQECRPVLDLPRRRESSGDR